MKAFLSHLLVAALACSTPLLTTVEAATKAEATAGRNLVKRFADTVVGIELVVTVKVKVGEREMPPREQKVDVNGTVISATGLTVTSLAEVDPQVAFEAMRASQTGQARIELLGADFKEVKLRLADGTEVPARFVLKDADLDLAFMAPEAGAAEKRQFTHVELDKKTDGALLDSFFFLARAPKALQRTPLIRRTDILGIVEKPRRLFLLTDEAIGTPVFDADGRILGITVQHFSGGRRTGIVVIPSLDIAEMAKQAAAAESSAASSAESAATPGAKQAEKTPDTGAKK